LNPFAVSRFRKGPFSFILRERSDRRISENEILRSAQDDKANLLCFLPEEERVTRRVTLFTFYFTEN
jgi:hypothetical protein